ncbi:MAG: thioesterase family protein [Rubrivivax sp.]|nr:thioesterase family protein [Rubrivivax sp.]
MPNPTPFSSLVAGRTRAGQTVTFDIADDWQQGRTAYGGVVSAIAAQAMRDVAGADWPADVCLRALQCSFVSVVEPGRVQVEVELLRQGRNVCQVMSRVIEGGRLGSVLMGVYSAERPSMLSPRRLQRPPARHEADVLPAVPYLPEHMPPFLQHLEMRWSEGALPYSGTPGNRSIIHLRLRDADADAIVPEVLTVLLADAPATPVIGELSQPVPSSSVTWALELRPLAGGHGAGWWRIDSESVLVEGGYVNHAARIWTPAGDLAAMGTQVVTVFA